MAVNSVNGQTGDVVLDADDLADGTSNVMMTTAERTTLASLDTVPTNTYTGGGTFGLADGGHVVEINSSSAATVTVPTNSAAPFPVNTVIELHRYGTGTVTLVASTGVTLLTPGGAPLTLRAQYSTATLRKRATDEWIVSGDLG